jgi:hypothetical protein
MSGLGLVLAVLFVPDVKGEVESDPKKEQSLTVVSVIREFNPFRIFKQWLYPNVFLAVSTNDSHQEDTILLQILTRPKPRI